MINVEKVNWEKVSGFSLGYLSFNNESGLPVVWNQEDKAVQVLMNGQVLLSYNQDQVKEVYYA